MLSAGFVAIFVFRLLSASFTDDHFDRISRAQQILAFGDVPFRDFFDPGFFLTLYSSAAVQALVGHNLLGEALLTTLCIAAGFTVSLSLAQRVSSWPVAVGVTLVGAATMPRLYDYDKVLFLPLGLLLCWQYVDRPSRRRLAALGVAIAVAAMYRFDTGIYLAFAALAGIAAVHGREWGLTLARGAALGGITVVMLLPALAFVQANGGVRDGFRQIAEYARREGRRTEIFAIPALHVETAAPLLTIGAPVHIRWQEAVSDSVRAQLERTYRLDRGTFVGGRTWLYELRDVSPANVRAIVMDDRVEDTSGIDRSVSGPPPTRRISVLPGVLTPVNAVAWLYYTLMALPLLALMAAFRATIQGERAARLWSAGVLSLVANLFLLRAPLDARFGDVAAPAIPLAAWLIPLLVSRVGARTLRSRLMGLAGAVSLGVSCVSVAVLYSPEWPHALDTQQLRRMADSPPPLSLMPASRTAMLVKYLRECTGPDDRVLAAWYSPALYFFSGRGFAGGMAAFFGGHWSGPSDQRLIVTRLKEQSVPIVVLEMRSYSDFRQEYPMVDAYLKTGYEPVAESSLGDPEGSYRVMLRKGLTPDHIDTMTGLPCLR